MRHAVLVRRPPPRPTGFTLVELLVVVGIISVLVGILLPALNKARTAAKATQCLSNVHQMFLAFQMFAINNHDYLPATSGATQPMLVNGVSQTVATRWYGGVYTPGSATPNIIGGTFYGPGSLLAPYWGVANVGGCPEFKDQEQFLRVGYGTCDYAYNNYAGTATSTGLGIKLSTVRRAWQKALVWDSGRFGTGGGTTVGFAYVDRTPFGYPTSGNPNLSPAAPDPNFHGRHSGKGSVAWFDGHASAVAPCYFDYPALGFPNMEAAKLRAAHVGVIDDDGNQTTDEHYAPAY